MALTAKNASTARGKNALGAVQASAFGADGDISPDFAVGNPFAIKVARVAYNFAVDGATVAHATAGMGLGVFFPKTSVVFHGILHVVTPVTGPTNASFSLENDADVLAGAAIAGNVGHAAGLLNVTVVPQTASTWVLTTALREFIFNGTVAATTAGAFTVHVLYIPSTAAAA